MMCCELSYECVHVYVCMCVYVCVYVCACVCVRAWCVCVHKVLTVPRTRVCIACKLFFNIILEFHCNDPIIP